MATFYTKQGDEAPIISTTLTGADGNPVNMTGRTARLRVANQKTGALVIDDPASPGGVDGNVTYQLTPAQADAFDWGLFLVEWIVDQGLITEETFPNCGHDDIYVERAL